MRCPRRSNLWWHSINSIFTAIIWICSDNYARNNCFEYLSKCLWTKSSKMGTVIDTVWISANQFPYVISHFYACQQCCTHSNFNSIQMLYVYLHRSIFMIVSDSIFIQNDSENIVNILNWKPTNTIADMKSAEKQCSDDNNDGYIVHVCCMNSPLYIKYIDRIWLSAFNWFFIVAWNVDFSDFAFHWVWFESIEIEFLDLNRLAHSSLTYIMFVNSRKLCRIHFMSIVYRFIGWEI